MNYGLALELEEEEKVETIFVGVSERQETTERCREIFKSVFDYYYTMREEEIPPKC